MDWSKVGSFVKKSVPMIAGLLPGPAGSIVGGLIASITGTEAEPDQVLKALKEKPSLLLELKKLEIEKKVELEKLTLQHASHIMAEETKRIESVNQTMREESKSDNWWTSGWRPYWGFVSGTAFGILVIFICILAYKAVVEKDVNAMLMIPQLITSFVGLFAIPGAILGVTAWHRGKKQRIEAGEKR